MNLGQAAQLLSTSTDHRVLRRVPPVERWQFAQPIGDVVRACVVDCETTGLEDNDEVIELGIVPFDYCKTTGRVTAMNVDKMLSAFRQPSVPIGEEVQKLTGITPEMVAGHAITDEQVCAAIDGCQLVIAHHAGFDRPHLEKLCAAFEALPWACSIEDVDWKAAGIGSSKLDYLLWKQGWFYEGHRATDDALATLWLLSLPLPGSNTTALSALLEHARKPSYLVRAEGTDFDSRGILKQRGYHWDDGSGKRSKAWVLTTNEPDAELAWLKTSAAWTPRSRAEVVRVLPTARFSKRI